MLDGMAALLDIQGMLQCMQPERSNEIEAVSTGLSRDSREVCTLQNRLASKLRRMNYTGGLVMEAC